MLEIESVTFRNFMSYGDYDTHLHLSNLGATLITGEIIANGDIDYNSYINSNGAGKSAVINSILWGLFGKVMYSSSPGDKIRNYYTNQPCVVKLQFKNGDTITRVRTPDGKTELLYNRYGTESKYTSTTQATTKQLQAALTRDFKLDWEVFTGSVFLTQYNNSWMELSDQARKTALERILRVDRFNLYSEVAKEQYNLVDHERCARRNHIANLDRDAKFVENEIARLSAAATEFETDRTARLNNALADINAAITARDAVVVHDLDKTIASWEIVSKVEAVIRAENAEALKLRGQAATIQITANTKAAVAADYRGKIKQWHQLAGRVCLACEQLIPHTHTGQKTDALVATATAIEAEVAKIRDSVNSIIERAKAIESRVAVTAAKLQSKYPTVTVRDAESSQRERLSLDNQIARAEELLRRIEVETNPYGPAIAQAQARLADIGIKRAGLESEIAAYNTMWTHYQYLYKAYSDRSKIKSHVFGQFLPFLNARLLHYMDLLDIDIKIQFTDTLGISTSRWGYEFLSGGERKRIDLAIMLGLFDLYEQLYGRQCNIMVLDEVDSRLDAAGVESLVQIIKNELATRVDSILIISHKHELMDTFQSHIAVERVDRLSYIKSIRS